LSGKLETVRVKAVNKQSYFTVYTHLVGYRIMSTATIRITASIQ